MLDAVSVLGLPGKPSDDPGAEPEAQRIVVCVECGCSSGQRWYGWGAYRVDEPDAGESPRLAFYCPACREREFGYAIWRRFR